MIWLQQSSWLQLWPHTQTHTHTLTCGHFPLGNINCSDWFATQGMYGRDEAEKIAEVRSGFRSGIGDYILESQKSVIKISILQEQVGHMINYKSN